MRNETACCYCCKLGVLLFVRSLCRFRRALRVCPADCFCILCLRVSKSSTNTDISSRSISGTATLCKLDVDADISSGLAVRLLLLVLCCCRPIVCVASHNSHTKAISSSGTGHSVSGCLHCAIQDDRAPWSLPQLRYCCRCSCRYWCSCFTYTT